MSNRLLCIYPKDDTTVFLQPVFEQLCSLDYVVGFHKDSTDDDFFEQLESLIQKSDTIIFLGHGASDKLFGTYPNPIFDRKIDEYLDNLKWLRDKKLILFACRSKEFIETFNYNQCIGFGLIPTSMEDLEGSFHRNVNLKKLDSLDIAFFNQILISIWKRTIENVTSLLDLEDFYNNFKLFANYEITNTLINCKEFQHYRTIADVLFYLKEDMKYFE